MDEILKSDFPKATKECSLVVPDINISKWLFNLYPLLIKRQKVNCIAWRDLQLRDFFHVHLIEYRAELVRLHKAGMCVSHFQVCGTLIMLAQSSKG